jgi:dienelactone hydrolase
MRALASFLSELKRRKVTRAAVAYAVAGMGVAEGAQLIFEAASLPLGLWRALVLVVLCGFPVALLAAWFLDVTPDGIRFARPSTTEELADPGRVTWGSISGWVVAALLVTFLAWRAFAHDDDTPRLLAAVAAVNDATDQGDLLGAYRLAMALPREIPDSTRQRILEPLTTVRRLTSEPEGATASWRPYGRPDVAWERLGTTPMEWAGPRDDVQILLEHEGYVPRMVVPGVLGLPVDVTLTLTADPHPDALRMAGGTMNLIYGDPRIGHAPPQELDPFLLDRYEVTNRQYKEFVDAGGYERKEFWEHPFEGSGGNLAWEEARASMVDRTGRPGPSTWVGGTYPEGKADHPVTGISWYEAAAYARYRGRDLPTVYHWYAAAAPHVGEHIVPFSNFGGEGTAPVGQYQGVSPYGAYDMAGNAREWLENATGDLRYTVGGGWNDRIDLFSLSQPQRPVDRSEANGVRLMTVIGDRSVWEAASRPLDPVTRDYDRERPVSDEVFEAFRTLYEYEDTPLDAVVESVDTLPLGIRERITVDAGYGQERLVLYLVRPLQHPGPLQAVLYVGGSGGFGVTGGLASSAAGSGTVALLVRSGRAVLLPNLKGMYERRDDFVYRLQDASNSYRDHVLAWRQDLGRTLDYLQTRSDIDPEGVGYLGVSFGGRLGGIFLAVEPRLRVGVLAVPGLSPLPTQPVADPLNFLPRIRQPVLVMSGEYDNIYPLETAARPFYRFLGTPEPDKKHFIAAGAHSIPNIDFTRETLDWLDRYLGKAR